MGLGMKQLNLDGIRSQTIRSIGLDPEVCAIESAEFIAAVLRRTASSLCPCTSSELIRIICDSVSPILKCPTNDFEQLVQQALESLIGNGDLIEEHEVETSLEIERRGRVLYLRPPSFVQRHKGSVLLIGVPSGNASILGPDLEKRIEYFSHVRRLSPAAEEDLPAVLRKIGLTEVAVDSWERRNMVPEAEAPDAYINKMSSKLKSNPGLLEGLEILHSDTNVRYYRSRWGQISKQSGCYVGRRPKAFGNKLWCYVEVQNGTPVRMVDLPALSKSSLGHDEAWRLQMAIDANRGNPQEFTVIRFDEDYRQVKFFSPVHSWAQRRWDNLAEPSGNDGCLFSYRFLADDLPQEVDFITKKLWLVEKT